MSAWVVSKAHIDALVNAGAQLGLVSTSQEAEATGKMLWRENVRSVNYRYDERSRTPAYKVETTEAEFHLAAVLAVLGCYEYKSCERPDWKQSAAYPWCERLREAAIAKLPPSATEQVRDGSFRVPRYKPWPAYENTPWGIDSLRDVPVVVNRDRRAAT